jgi:hypothetical protein
VVVVVSTGGIEVVVKHDLEKQKLKRNKKATVKRTKKREKIENYRNTLVYEKLCYSNISEFLIFY